MKNKYRSMACWCASIALLLAGCAHAPNQEMSDARQSVQAARDSGAAKHAGELLQQAEDLLHQAEEELGRRYFKRARDEAIAARTAAVEAHDIAVAIKQAQEAIAAVHSHGSSPDDAEILLRQALEAANAGDGQRAIGLANEAKTRAELILNQ